MYSHRCVLSLNFEENRQKIEQINQKKQNI
jgi:hypothetical protein